MLAFSTIPRKPLRYECDSRRPEIGPPLVVETRRSCKKSAGELADRDLEIRERTLPTRTGSIRQLIAMYNANAPKIGLVGPNCSSAPTPTLVPERRSA